MTLPPVRRPAMVNAGSPAPAAKSKTTESGLSFAGESKASVIAVGQCAAASTQESSPRALAAASHGLRFVTAEV
jgi:hypothetical protein